MALALRFDEFRYDMSADGFLPRAEALECAPGGCGAPLFVLFRSLAENGKVIKEIRGDDTTASSRGESSVKVAYLSIHKRLC
jgi:hypothetical protein